MELMKSLMHLLREVLHDMGDLCCVSTIRDFETISKRVEYEGLSFLTITLPALAKEFERALDVGSVRSSDFLGFSKKGRLPRFCGGFFDLVFDRETGHLLSTPSHVAILAVRQILLSCKKFEAECTPYRVRKCVEGYLVTDIDLSTHYCELPDFWLETVTDVAKVLFGPVLNELEKSLSKDPCFLVPKHGPGTTSSGTKANAKFEDLHWTDRLSKHFSPYDFLIPSWKDDRIERIDHYHPGIEPPVRVVTVPKTLKTPRIIAIEPVHMQYMQQSLLEVLVPLLESRRMYGSLGFTDQSVSQNLALKSSIDGTLATLDLSEASDRVANPMVEAMLKSWPILSDMIQCMRTTHADVPGHGVQPIFKFASMGSALCFPIEAMVFLTLSFMSVHGSASVQTMKRNRCGFLRRVRIYGDDIIVPVGMAQTLACEFSAFGLKINEHKSFWTGKFRESCGGDFYEGTDVKPLYIKCEPPTSRHQVREVESTVSFRNLCYKAGMWRTAAYLDKCISSFAPFPVVDDASPVLGRVSFLTKGRPIEKMCKNLHRPLVFGMVPKRTIPKSKLDGYGALMKFFLKRGDEPFFRQDHLEFDGRPISVAITNRWASAG
jgi:hypothetical protein